jgi:hypothetical protein
LPVRTEPEPAFWEWLDGQIDETIRRHRSS